MLSQEIGQVHPSNGFSKPDHGFLGPIQLTRTMMMGVVMVVVVVMMMVMLMLMMMVVVVISDAADSESVGIKRKKEGFVAGGEGREKQRFEVERVEASES